MSMLSVKSCFQRYYACFALFCSIYEKMKNGVEDKGRGLKKREENCRFEESTHRLAATYTAGRSRARSRHWRWRQAVLRETARRQLIPPGSSQVYGKPPGATLVPPGGGLLGLGLFSVALLTYIYPYCESRVILLTGEDDQT